MTKTVLGATSQARVVFLTAIVLAGLGSTLLVNATPSAGGDVAGSTTLRTGTPQEAGFLPGQLGKLPGVVRQGTRIQNYGHPAYPGGVVLAARNGVVAMTYATGFARRYANKTTELPRRSWIAAKPDTIYDLASLSKIFTATVVVQLLAKGRLNLDDAAAKYLPQFASQGKGSITIRQLLTHTSGLAPDPTPALWNPVYTNNAQRWAGVFATVPDAAPGTAYAYSDINYLVLGKVIERVTRQSLAANVYKGITRPLKMMDTMYNPRIGLRKRIAATEYQEPPNEPARGMVWGRVHDENAWAVGGVAGHAGLFSTVRDLSIFSQTVLNGGAYGDARIYPKAWAKTFFRDYNKAFPGYGHSLTMQVNQYPRFFGAMDSNHTIGHTGYAGTSIVINPYTKSFNVLLTNRVHPTRDWTPLITPNPQRGAVGDVVARAVAVVPRSGKFSWFSGMINNPVNVQPLAKPGTLTVPVPRRGAGAVLHFNLWYQLLGPQIGVPAERVALQSSIDGGQTWQPMRFRTRGGGQIRVYPDGTFTGLGVRGWRNATAMVPAAGAGRTVLVRWKYTSGTPWQGRGLYVNHVVVKADGKIVFDDSRPSNARMVRTTGGFTRSAT